MVVIVRFPPLDPAPRSPEPVFPDYVPDSLLVDTREEISEDLVTFLKGDAMAASPLTPKVR